jgi:transposase
MANSRLSMRKIVDVLRLHFEGGRSQREIGHSLSCSPTTVGEILRRAKLAKLSWPLPAGESEAGVQARLYPPAPHSHQSRAEPDWPAVHAALRRKGVTLDLLWQEYQATYPDGYRYSGFCEHYRAWQGKLTLTLRQTHVPGEKLFIDYAGPTVPVIDGASGEIRQAAIFVAVLGASNYTYVEATWSQSLPDWIGAHVRALEFFQGVPRLLVPDNLKSGVATACFFEPELNPTYRDLACHYGTAVLPARPRKPRDKAKVEAGVLLVERWVLARLRNARFFSLAELNRALADLLTRLNERPFKKLPGCRRGAFESLDRPALLPLPAQRFEFAQWKVARVGIDYHVEVLGHYYSVPHRHAREKVEVRLTATTVEVFQRGTRIASHARSLSTGRHTTLDAHMPAHHRAVSGWTPERLVCWANAVGPLTTTVVERVLHGRKHPRSRATAVAWASCAWPRTSAMRAWRPPASGPCRWAACRSATCIRF